MEDKQHTQLYTDARTPEQLKRLHDELMSEAVRLNCSQHNKYDGNIPPSYGCKGCWQMYYFKSMAKLAPEDRDEVLDLLEMAVNHAVEAEKRGELDIDIWRHPKVDIQKSEN